MRAGIIGAMEMEVAYIKEQLQDGRTVAAAGMDFFSGKLAGVDAVVVRSGVGKVNAAVCTQILADFFRVDFVINTGVAGSLDARINIGDIVISTDAVQYDMDVSVFGYQPGQIPGMSVLAFPADERLASLAETICRKVNPDLSVYRGRVMTGDRFVADMEVKKMLSRQFQGLCTEMEGGAVAQAAWMNKVPFVIIRAISDRRASWGWKTP